MHERVINWLMCREPAHCTDRQERGVGSMEEEGELRISDATTKKQRNATNECDEEMSGQDYDDGCIDIAQPPTKKFYENSVMNLVGISGREKVTIGFKRIRKKTI